MDAEKTRLARGASYLLPDPGGEVVRDLLSVIDRIRDERDALAEQVAKMREALEHITEYWNQGENPMAMSDALWHIIETAEDAIAPQPGKEEPDVSNRKGA